MYRSLLVVLMGLMVCSPVVAADVEGTATVMGEVVVTATRQAEEISEVPANVTVVTAEEIERSSAQSIPELLRSVGGILVNDIAGNGRNYTVDLRGFGETASLNTLVLIDGRRINQADLSGVDWSLIPKDRVERIEIVRGGRGSVLYGDNAAGGIINIMTKKGGQDLDAGVKLSAGSYDSFNGSLSASGEANDLLFAVNGHYRTSDGYRENSETDAKDIGLNLEYMATDRFSFQLNTGYHKDETSLPGALTKSELASGISRRTSLHPDDYADIEDWYLQGITKIFVTDNSYLDLDISKRTRKSQFFSFFSVGEYEGNTQIDTLAISPQLVVNEQLLGHDTKILLGIDFEDSVEDIVNTSIFFGIPSIATYELSKENYGYFSHAEVSLTDSLTLSGGYRNDRADFKFKSIDLGTTEKNRIDEDLYTVGVNYVIRDNSSVYASYAKSFRYPVLDEMYNFFFNTVDSSLRAQSSDDFEIGVRYQTESGMKLGLNLFHIVTEDEVFYNPVSFANENLDGDSIRQGIELMINKELGNVQLSGNYTFQDTEIDGGQFDGKEMPNVPQHQFSLGVQVPLCSKIQAGLNGTYVGERRYISDFANTHAEQDDYFFLTGKLTWLLEKGSAFIAVNNLLDEEYSEYGALNFLGEEGVYPSPGINFVAGLNLRF